MTALQVPHDGWTVENLPDVEFGYELVDGGLLVTPPPELRHDVLADALAQTMRAVLPPDLALLTEPGVHVDERNYRRPDIAVFRRSAIARNLLRPADVVLAVEVVSPGSRSTDRITKPAQYADAGIAHYWRLEQDPLELITYALDGHTYRETARFDDHVSVTEPIAVRFRLSELLEP